MSFDKSLTGAPQSPRPLRRARKVLFVAGVALVALGFAALIAPVISSLIVGFFIGWLLFMGGVIMVATALSLRGTGQFFWQLLAGLVPLMAGAFLIVFPAQGVVALTVLVAVLFLVTGVAQSAFALWARPSRGWGWGLASAGVSIALGAWILLALPEASEVLLGILVGIDFVTTGAALIVIARAARRSAEVRYNRGRPPT